MSSTTWKQEVRDGLRDAWAAPTREEAEARLQRLVTKARKRVPSLAGALAIERNEQWLERRYMVFKSETSTKNNDVTPVA